MTRNHSPGRPGILAVAAVSVCIMPSICSGQTLPVPRGATVRVMRADTVQSPLWSTGRVVYASRDSLLLAETDGDPLVRYNEVLRVQIQKQQSMTVAGGTLGLIAGAIAGWQASSAIGGSADQAFEKAASTIICGAAGVATGAILGNHIRRSTWRDVPLDGYGRSIAPLNGEHTDPEFTLSRTVRWTSFEPTVADFEAFFMAHADSLDPIEGIWSRHGTHKGVAIVRVTGTNAEQYAAYSLNQYPGRPSQPQDGVVLFVLNRTNDENEWECQLARSTPRRFTAQVFPDLIELEYPNAVIDRWEKLLPN